MNWYYEIKGPFCSTFFTYNGSQTTKIEHLSRHPDGMTTTLNWGDVNIHDKPFKPTIDDYDSWVSWCKEYATMASSKV